MALQVTSIMEHPRDFMKGKREKLQVTAIHYTDGHTYALMTIIQQCITITTGTLMTRNFIDTDLAAISIVDSTFIVICI